MLEVANVAISERPFGTVAGVQLVAVFQSPLGGVRFQVALPANNGSGTKDSARKPVAVREEKLRASDLIRKKRAGFLSCELATANAKKLRGRYLFSDWHYHRGLAASSGDFEERNNRFTFRNLEDNAFSRKDSIGSCGASSAVFTHPSPGRLENGPCRCASARRHRRPEREDTFQSLDAHYSGR